MEDVKASPTKRFFVSMLTRDIELKDAILDLLDNCIDGILRSQKDVANLEKPYSGYWAKIIATPENFSIMDNCGGIPKQIAKESAFRLGRIEDKRDSNIPTLGMYGIGMKRAIFKMGKNSAVRSQHEGEAYEVKITEQWLRDDSDWILHLQPIFSLFEQDGTEVSIRNLYPQIASEFDPQGTDFLDDLRKEIARLFALIIKKGFTVYLNDTPVRAESLDIVYTRDFNSSAIQPYGFKVTFQQVEIDMIVGFYRQLATTEEIDADIDIPREEVKAGWTVICNDRVVLYRDRSGKTGWGLGSIPNYHPQYRSIAGVVQFSSNESDNLPLTTTKRGIDMSSPTYLLALKYMQEGVRKFIDYTNKWKGRERDTVIQFEEAIHQDAIEVVRAIPEDKWKPVRGYEGNAMRFTPELPLPPKTGDRVRILYYRLASDVEKLGEYLFEEPEASPADIGGRCFDEILKIAKGE